MKKSKGMEKKIRELEKRIEKLEGHVHAIHSDPFHSSEPVYVHWPMTPKSVRG